MEAVFDDRPARSPGPRLPTVLVVDDNPAFRRLVAITLGRGTFDTLEAADGIEALRQIQAYRPAVVILDLTMPHLDGLGVCRAIGREVDGLKMAIVVVTGQENSQVREQCLALGVDGFLTKPVSPLLLRDEIRRLVPRAGTNG